MLTVFDFDHTLVDGNTDTWITNMHPATLDLIRSHQKKGWCWTDIMDKVFGDLHSQNLQKDDYHKCFKTLPFTPGMKETCEFLHSNNIESIIISDSNTEFINHLLTRDSLGKVFSMVYTNPAEWDDNGCLHVKRYHSHHNCNQCPLNLCKGEVLKKHIEKHSGTYDHIVFIGDGKGDLCPCLSLKHGDYAVAREGYKLLQLLRDQEFSDSQAIVVPWRSGFEVLELFKSLCSN